MTDSGAQDTQYKGPDFQGYTCLWPCLEGGHKRPDKTLADGNEWSMTDILNKMSIYEVITSRNGGCESGVPVRFIADLNTMSFRSWEEMKNPPNHIEQPSIPSSLLDTEVEEVKDEWDDAPF